MTRQEFAETEYWSDLFWVCEEARLDIMNYIMTDEQVDEYIDEQLRENIENESWYTWKDWLQDIPQGYEYYKLGYGLLDIEGLDDSDFEDLKSEIIEAVDDDFWDDDGTEDDEELEDEPEQQTDPSFGEMFSLSELVSA